jgi:hypothetical protein
MIRLLFALSLLAPLCAASPARAERKIESGEWEQVMTITSPKTPQPAQRTVRHCITSEDARIFVDPERWAQEMVKANPAANCKIEESKQEGKALSVVLACDGDMRLHVRHDFEGRNGTIEAESMVGGVSQGRNHIVSKKVADTCSPETIEQWKRQNPGRSFAP